MIWHSLFKPGYIRCVLWDILILKVLWSFRVEKLKKQFKHLYVVVAVPTREQNDSFNQSYLGYVDKLKREEFHVYPCKSEISWIPITEPPKYQNFI